MSVLAERGGWSLPSSTEPCPSRLVPPGDRSVTHGRRSAPRASNSARLWRPANRRWPARASQRRDAPGGTVWLSPACRWSREGIGQHLRRHGGVAEPFSRRPGQDLEVDHLRHRQLESAARRAQVKVVRVLAARGGYGPSGSAGHSPSRLMPPHDRAVEHRRRSASGAPRSARLDRSEAGWRAAGERESQSGAHDDGVPAVCRQRGAPWISCIGPQCTGPGRSPLDGSASPRSPASPLTTRRSCRLWQPAAGRESAE
jgi:hypothetical protein